MALNLTDNSAGIGLYRETVTGVASSIGASAGVAACSGTGVGIVSAVGSAAGSASISGVSSGTIGSGAGASSGTGSVSGGGVNNLTRMNVGVWQDFGFAAQTNRSWSVATQIQLGAAIGAFGDVEIQIDLEVRPGATSTPTKTLNAVSGLAAGTSTAQAYAGSQGASAGIASVTGVGQLAGGAFGQAPGISAGSSTAAATGALASIGVGNSTGASTAAAQSFQAASTGQAAGTSSALAVTSTIIVVAVGRASGTSTAIGGRPIPDPGTAIENTNAISFATQYWICDRTGFRVPQGELVKEWTGAMVRKQSWEARHPQDFVRGVAEHQKGSQRPEQEDQFIEEAVSSEDL